jgi:hypothetical protein
MIKKDIINLSKDTTELAKNYWVILYEISNGRNVTLLNTYSNEDKRDFLLKIYIEMKPHLN